MADPGEGRPQHNLLSHRSKPRGPSQHVTPTSLAKPPSGAVPESSELTGYWVQIKLILSRGSIQRLGSWMPMSLGQASRDLHGPHRNPASPRLGDRPSRTPPKACRAGPPRVRISHPPLP